MVNKLNHKGVLNVVALSSDIRSNIFKIRIAGPLGELERAGRIRVWCCDVHEFQVEQLLWGDVFIIQRDVSPRVDRLVVYLQKTGKPYIFEIDDLLIDMPDFLGHHKETIKNKEKIEKTIREAATVTVTTPVLARNLAEYNQHIQVVPNYSTPISLPHLQAPAGPQRVGSVSSVLVAASDRVLVDFVKPALMSIAQRYGKRVRVVCIGNICADLADIPSIELFPILPLPEFKKLVGELPEAIGVIPLDDSRFSSCKSAVKYFDYASLGVAAVCSKVSPYVDVITDNENGVLVPSNAPEAWFQSIDALLQQPELRTRIANAAREHVATHHGIDQAARAWIDAISEVASRTAAARKGVLPNGVLLRFRIEKYLLTLRRLNRKRLEARKLRRANRAQPIKTDTTRP